MSEKQIRKGGAEKLRIKKEAERIRVAKSCKDIKSFFKKPSSGPDLSDILEQRIEICLDIQSNTSEQSIEECSDKIDEHDTLTGPDLSDALEQCIEECLDIQIDEIDVSVSANSINKSDKSNTLEKSIEECFDEIDGLDTLTGLDLSDTLEKSIEECFDMQSDEIDVGVAELDYFQRPMAVDLVLFFNFHPCTNTIDRKFLKAMTNSDGTKRQWLSYSTESKSLYCSFCLAFSAKNHVDAFVTGFNKFRHIYERVDYHQKTKIHLMSSTAFMEMTTESNLKSKLFKDQLMLNKSIIMERRTILLKVIDIIKVIGKCGIGFRGSKYESASTWNKPELNHGIFLEITFLLAKYENSLQQHIDKCIKKSNNLQGRGSSVTLLSKTTLNTIISIIKNVLQSSVVKAVQEAEFYSIELDTSLDNSVQDQCSLMVRYVQDQNVYERLLAFVPMEKTTGEAFFETFENVAKLTGLNRANCVGGGSDGASNMIGIYKGFSAYMKKFNDEYIHMWCNGHKLNLVIGDVTNVVINVASFFSMLNGIGVFFHDSHPRMAILTEKIKSTHNERINRIGETRWWAKDVALRKMFGNYDSEKSNFYRGVIESLCTIENSQTKPEVRATARGFKDSLLSYETVMTAKLFLRLFDLTSPLSKYLQTIDVDILRAINMISKTKREIIAIQRDFEDVKLKTDKFIDIMNYEFQLNHEFDLEIETTFPSKRNRTNSCENYKINVYNVVLDKTLTEINERFCDFEKLCSGFSYYDPKNFEQFKDKPLKHENFSRISKILYKFNNSATAENLCLEHKQFISHWDGIKSSCDPNDDKIKSSCDLCLSCTLCCYKVLIKYNLINNTFPLTGLTLKLILTLAVTSVSCERSFSWLKKIKDRLRSMLDQEKLEAFMFMALEKDLLNKINSNIIIDKLAEKSKLMRSLLAC